MIEKITEIVLSVVAFLISVSCHEFSHSLSAYVMGDDTAKRNGRMSLNPLRHFDIISLLFFVAFHFGWAKGVPIDERNFKDRKKGMVLSALAGPVTNIILGFISFVIFSLILKMQFKSELMYNIFYYIAMFLNYMVNINAMLAIFNLLPIPPLDGSKILLFFLPEKYYFKILSYDRYMMIVSLILVYVGALDKVVLNGVNNLINVFEKIVGVFM